MSLLDLSSVNLLKFSCQIRTDSDKPKYAAETGEEGVSNDKELFVQLLHFQKTNLPA